VYFSFEKLKIKNEYKQSEIIYSFSGSQALVLQIEQGVEADIFLSANKKYIDFLNKKGLIENIEKFAKNSLVIAVLSDSSLEEMDDIVKKEYKSGIPNIDVPIGAYTMQVLSNLETEFPGIKKNFYSNSLTEALSAQELMTKLKLGEVDCIFAYKTDLIDINQNDIKLIEVSDKYNIETSYYAAVLKMSKNKEEAKKFMYNLLNGDGKLVLEKYGFEL